MNIDNRIAQNFAPIFFFVVVASAASFSVGAGLRGESAPTAIGVAPAQTLPAATYAAVELDHSVIAADARRADDAETVEASIAAYER
jgi:hypothetical protein